MLDQEGQRFGAYTVVREIGRGGMGVVYLARDTRLERDVAIKALPDHLASDPARLERFEREARTLAGLSHPNVAGIFGFEEHEGASYLVLEYVGGETLADRLDRGPIPVEEALDLAAQVASGVEAAHEAGVIHRDLKPANVKVTSEGEVKVLDFGLARADESQSSTGAPLDSPTIATTPQHSPTIAGAILGTAAYMSPEQARGRRVDRRTDVWSFGVLLYEMLTGAGPFHGETATDSIGAVLHKEPDLGLLPAGVPGDVRRLVRRCLERDKTRRLQSIGDARIELVEAAERLASGEAGDAPGAAPRAGGVGRWAWPAVAVVALAALGATIPMWAGRGAGVGPAASDAPAVVGVARVTDVPGAEYDLALSPDGRSVAYTGLDGANGDIFVLRVGGSRPINLTADSEAHDLDPAFSPDGERIAFFSTREGGGLFVMGATGEDPRRVSDVGFDPAWSPDGRSIAFTTEQVRTAMSRTQIATVWVLDLETGERRRLLPYEEDDPRHDGVQPAWSPDGRWIAYWSVDGGQRDLFVAPAAGGERITITDDAPTDWNPMWSSDGRRLYFLSDRSGRANLWWIAIDPESGRAAGEPRPLSLGPTSLGWASISADGTKIAAMVNARSTALERVSFDPDSDEPFGPATTIHSSAAGFNQTDALPDGSWVTFTSTSPTEDIVILRGDGTGLRRLTDDEARDRGPKWTPSGESVLYYSNRDGGYRIWEARRDTTEARPLTAAGAEFTTFLLSPDGATVAAHRQTGVFVDLHLLERAEDGTLPHDDAPFAEDFIATGWSPDGLRLVGAVFEGTGTAPPIATMDVETGRRVRIVGPGGEPLTALEIMLTWLDNDRVIGWSYVNRRTLIADASTGRARWLDEGLPEGTGAVVPINGGSELIYEVDEFDSDIWMYELDGAGGAE